jgi:hypothetical protein
MMSSVIASSSGSITSATLAGSACHGPVCVEVVIQVSKTEGEERLGKAIR